MRGSSTWITQLISFFFIAFGIACILLFRADGGVKSSGPKNLVYPPKDLRYFVFGYDEAVADFMWIRVLQEFDKCDQAALHQSADGSKTTYCENSWAFAVLFNISELAPRFKVPMRAGAQLLSTVLNDRKGAGTLYAIGVQHFPTDWRLAYQAGYQAMADLDNSDLAAKYLEQAAGNGAPQWLHSLVAKLYTKEGRVDLAKSVLESALEKEGGEYEDRIRKTYEEVLKKIQESPDGRIRH